MKVYVTNTKKTVEIPQDSHSCSLKELLQFNDASIDDLIVFDILDYCPNRTEVLMEIIKKMRYGASLFLTGINLNSVATSIVSGTIDIKDAQQYLYNGRQSTTSVLDTVEEIESLNINVDEFVISGLNYEIRARRPSIKLDNRQNEV